MAFCMMYFIGYQLSIFSNSLSANRDSVLVIGYQLFGSRSLTFIILRALSLKITFPFLALMPSLIFAFKVGKITKYSIKLALYFFSLSYALIILVTSLCRTTSR